MKNLRAQFEQSNSDKERENIPRVVPRRVPGSSENSAKGTIVSKPNGLVAVRQPVVRRPTVNRPPGPSQNEEKVSVKDLRRMFEGS